MDPTEYAGAIIPLLVLEAGQIVLAASVWLNNAADMDWSNRSLPSELSIIPAEPKSAWRGSTRDAQRFAALGKTLKRTKHSQRGSSFESSGLSR